MRLRIDTDHHLQEMMHAAVQRLHAGSIDIELTDNSVLLVGSVSSWADKQSAQERIRSMSSSRVIDNQLLVPTWQ